MKQNNWDTRYMIYIKAQSVLRPDTKSGPVQIIISLPPDKQIVIRETGGMVRATLDEPGRTPTRLNNIEFARLKPKFGSVRVIALDPQTDLGNFPTYEEFLNRLSVGMGKRT